MCDIYIILVFSSHNYLDRWGDAVCDYLKDRCSFFLCIQKTIYLICQSWHTHVYLTRALSLQLHLAVIFLIDSSADCFVVCSVKCQNTGENVIYNCPRWDLQMSAFCPTNQRYCIYNCDIISEEKKNQVLIFQRLNSTNSLIRAINCLIKSDAS